MVKNLEIKMSGNQTKMEKLLLHAGRVLTSTLDYEELIQLIVELAIKATDAEAALVYRIDKKSDKMRVRFGRCSDQEIQRFDMPKGEGIIGWVADKREPVMINNVGNDTRFSDFPEKFIGLKINSVIVVPLIGRGHMIGVIEVINKKSGAFDESDLDMVIGLANQFAVAIDNANLYRKANQKAMEQQLLYEVGKTLSSTLNLDEVLKQILDSLQKVVGFDAGGVFLIDEAKGDVNTIYSQGYDTHEEVLQLKVGQGLVGWAAKTAESAIVGDVSLDDRYVAGRPGTRSEIAVPIKVDGRIIGVLNLESNQSSAYDQNSLELLNTFASQAAISIERAYLHNKMLESKGLEEQLAVARQIQLSFLPKKNPVVSGYDISGINIPSGDVGGDYFDFIRIVDGQTGIAVADVSGKGVPAALIMASFRASLIAEIRNNYAIRVICRKVNSLLYESLERDNYVTAFYGVLDSKNNILTFANCGHNQPILLRNDGQVEFLKEGGMALGVLPDSEYEERAIYIHSGDLIVFYTDGVTEVVNENKEEFGQAHLIEIVKQHRQLSATELQNAIYKKVKRFASPKHVFDDLTMIILKRL